MTETKLLSFKYHSRSPAAVGPGIAKREPNTPLPKGKEVYNRQKVRGYNDSLLAFLQEECALTDRMNGFIFTGNSHLWGGGEGLNRDWLTHTVLCMN